MNNLRRRVQFLVAATLSATEVASILLSSRVPKSSPVGDRPSTPTEGVSLLDASQALEPDLGQVEESGLAAALASANNTVDVARDQSDGQLHYSESMLESITDYIRHHQREIAVRALQDQLHAPDQVDHNSFERLQSSKRLLMASRAVREAMLMPLRVKDHQDLELIIKKLRDGDVDVEASVRDTPGMDVRAKANNNQSDPSNNYCVRGKLLPQFYLLGAQKSGTTTLSSDLEAVGLEHAGEWKEFHFVDKFYQGGIPHPENELDYDNMRREWLEHLPPCPEHKFQMLADYTPCNIRIVPLPERNTPTGTQWGLWTLNNKGTENYQEAENGRQLNLPYTLHRLVGHRASRRMTFVVLLREPLARMQSAWYASAAATEDDPTIWQQCSDCKSWSFEAALQRSLHHAEQETPIYDDWLWGSLYARHLSVWLQEFDPKQFFIIPYLLWVRGGQTKLHVCHALNGHMEFPIDCDNIPGQSVTNVHEHPIIREDINITLVHRFDSLMEMENHLLYDLLQVAFKRGTGLALFANNWRGKNRTADAVEVRKWLHVGW